MCFMNPKRYRHHGISRRYEEVAVLLGFENDSTTVTQLSLIDRFTLTSNSRADLLA